jgi:hypothetical protein
LSSRYSDIESASETEAVGRYPWGDSKAREGRGNIVKNGKAKCSQREIDLGCALLTAAWLSGEWDLDWLIWPEEDELKLGEAVKKAWKAVQDQQVEEGRATHTLGHIVARRVCISLLFYLFYTNLLKMRDCIGDKRTEILKRVRQAVTLEFGTHPEHINEKTRTGFWKGLLIDHAVLSPNQTQVRTYTPYNKLANNK